MTRHDIDKLDRARGLAMDLNRLMIELPDYRLASNGCHVMVEEGRDKFFDPGLDTVAVFQRAFSQPLASEPIDLNTATAQTDFNLVNYQEAAARLGEGLKVAAQQAREMGDETGARLLIRLQLIQEELAELALGMFNADKVEVLDALTDLTYVVDGSYLALGMGSYKLVALAEVHRSNMSKLGPDGKPVMSSAGRVVKGPNYQPPDLARLLREGE